MYNGKVENNKGIINHLLIDRQHHDQETIQQTIVCIQIHIKRKIEKHDPNFKMSPGAPERYAAPTPRVASAVVLGFPIGMKILPGNSHR